VAGADDRVASQHTVWKHLRLRPTERGWLEADFAVERVWTITKAG
jgi:hypothetical protein